MQIYGKNAAKEALLKENVRKAYVYEKFKDGELLELLREKNVSTIFMPKNKIDNMEKGNHQGIILVVDDYEYLNIEDVLDDEVVVILDHLEDPHNLGAIIRTCEAAGVKSIVIPKDRSVKVNSTVMKVSVGCLENVNVALVSNINLAIDKLKNSGFWIIGTDMKGTDFKEIDYSGKIALVIGNEGSGINNLTKKKCDFMATIPMKGTVNSLNASVAAALVIYEAVRNR